MKPLPAIGAGLLAAFLLLSPLAMAAAPTISVSPTSVSGSQTITISGTTTASASVGLKVTNPSGTTVFIDNVVATSGGAYTDSFAAGGTAAWVTGTYTAAATVASQTSTATFQYTATAPAGSYNVTRALINIQGNQTIIENWLKSINASITADHSTDNSIMTSLNSLAGQVNSLSSSVGTLSTNVGNIQSAVNSLTSQVSTISSNVQSLSSQLPSAGTISNTQTYVLVVAVLAAITLVLELAILVRKLS